MSVTKLLIANRGGIACRVIRTCREMNIPTVAVYSDHDRGGMHVRLAEESRHIGPTPSRESYLRVEKIIDAARSTGADAVHPGYGFFSEDAEAARQIMDAGLTWVGPTPEVLEKMTNKISARALAKEAGVPVLPAITEILDDEALLREAQELGFPLMVKPVVGRDGKGMRLVRSVAELRRALPRVKGDALFSFWDERVYLEKAVLTPRHVEVQVFGDQQGNVVHLWDRDCSIQRRYQQLGEEAPSPSMDENLRAKVCQAAVALAKHIGYIGAGAVEFLLDAQGNFFFLEMTCRLQGSHPVTEWVTQQDLVRWQLQVARGESLPLKQEDIPMMGHAVQCRINAEDPDRDFAPSSGKICYLRTPTGHRMRDDNGIYVGWVMSPFYAPLLSRISTWAPNRAEAISRMFTALGEYRVGGVRSNVAFHKALTEFKPFVSGNYHTGSLDTPFWKHPGERPRFKFAVAAALFDELEIEEQRAQQPSAISPEDGDAWKRLSRFNRL